MRLFLLLLAMAPACINEPPPQYRKADLREAEGVELRFLGELIDVQIIAGPTDPVVRRTLQFGLFNHSESELLYFGDKDWPVVVSQILMPSGEPWQDQFGETCGNITGPQPRWRVLAPGATVRFHATVELFGAAMRARCHVKTRDEEGGWSEGTAISQPFSRERTILTPGVSE